jgi:hypothetical protein
MFYPKLVFLHIEKSAGTSLREFFYSFYGKNNVFWHGIKPEYDKTMLSHFVVGGHRQYLTYDERVRSNAIFLAIVREPVSRVVSLYNYLVRYECDNWSRHKGFDSSSLKSTIFNCSAFRRAVSNAQCRYLCGGESFNKVTEFIGSGNYFVGSMDHLASFEMELKERLGAKSESIEKHNVGDKGYHETIDIDDQVISEIKSLVEEDDKLFNYIKNMPSGYLSTVSNEAWQEVREASQDLNKHLGKRFSGFLKVSDFSTPVAIGERFFVDVEIFNKSNYDWVNEVESPVKISYHWLTPDKEFVEYEGMRTVISNKVISSEELVKARAVVKSPACPGQYLLMVTCIKERVGWFESDGFSPGVVEVVVE